MRDILEKLEHKLHNTAGLTVIDKRDDGFAYSVAIQRGDETFVVYTTHGIHHFKNENCLIMFQVTQHIPFESVSPTVNGDFISPYVRTIFREGTRIGNEMYGLSVEQLPIFQNVS